MLINFLAHVPEFRLATRAELEGLVRASNVLCLPAGRWIVQRDRNLGAYFYLLKGSVQTWNPDGVVKAGRNHQHVYPGCASVKTKSACQILRVDSAHRDLIVARQHGLAAELQGHWLTRFLESKMMKCLSKAEWQALLTDSRQVCVEAGEVVVEEGSQGDECYVIESGHGRVHRGGTTLRKIGPGDFFGEDAVVAHVPRSADVTASQRMVLHAIKGDTFCRLVVPRLVTTVTHASGGIKLNLGDQLEAGAIPVDTRTIRERAYTFDPRQKYFLVGGRWQDRNLCAFLLVQRGLQASVVAGPTGFVEEALN